MRKVFEFMQPLVFRVNSIVFSGLVRPEITHSIANFLEGKVVHHQVKIKDHEEYRKSNGLTTEHVL